ncbi:hypothetical protein BDV95DRAFT_653129 [Massariosphaeria phaeospora]|uniref:BZIP domain-containing protein n=1 Tax=Massariosphaeria phaeospora TaxID=100035 RepID=A0A7C8HYI0_9PLEO|nr:hypothetical protein BDV95DRAFT_653129 [Massariosphaeria phaeospora]
MTSILQYREPVSYRSYDLMSSSNYAPPHMASLRKTPPYEEHSSGSESKKQSLSGAKRRPSRAGTRSVSTLTTAQLERKRANDREAQRAIRQRTKDHIDSLERQVRDLNAQLETNSSGKMMELLRRNEELEQENAILRTRLSHAAAAMGDHNGVPGSAPSPSDRMHIQPRRSSTGTVRNSVPEIATPGSQPGHWQQQAQYSPHVEASSLGEPSVPQDTGRWSPHPAAQQQQHHPASLPVQEQSLHAVDQNGMSYPSPYGLDNNSRAMSYPLEQATLVTSQPMQMSGYGTPTSNASPHPSEYRHLSVPMHAPPVGHPHHVHPQHPPAQYSPYPNPGQQAYVSRVTHSNEAPMQMMAPSAHPQPQMMGEHGHMMYHMHPNMKVEH